MLRQCPTIGVPYLVGDNKNEQTRKIIKARCKQWDCEYCAIINREQHYNRVANGLYNLDKRGYKFQFVTITCHEKWRGHKNSVKNWRANKDKLLARFRRKIKREKSYSAEYVYIPEIHTDGTIHIHGLFSGQFSTRWWKDSARACGLGYMAESAKLTSIFQAVNYVFKYITKQVGISNVQKNFRRINYSRGFPAKVVVSSQLDWRILETKESIRDAILSGLIDRNYAVEFDGKNWTFDDLY